MLVMLSRRAFLKLAGLGGAAWAFGLRLEGGDVPKPIHLRLLATSRSLASPTLAAFAQSTGAQVDLHLAERPLSVDGYDLVIIPSHKLLGLIQAGRIRELGLRPLPVSLEQRPYDPLNAFSVPAAWGAIGINTRRGLPPPTSWAELFALARTEPAYLPPVETFHAALKMLGKPLNARDFAARNQARALVSGLESTSLAYARLAVGAAQPGWQFTVPVEGAELWEDCFCIPADSAQPDLAQAFIRGALATHPLPSLLLTTTLEPRSPFAPSA